MIDLIETLISLKKYQTMGHTATALRITQSTVSKRIKSLEETIGKTLIVHQGRRVVLTSDAKVFLEKVTPHVLGIKEATGIEASDNEISIDFGFSESILSSWGSELVGRVQSSFSNISILPHAHRGPVVIDKIRSGNYLFGICPGGIQEPQDIMSIELGFEPMVLMGKSLSSKIPLMTVEPLSETWRSMEREALKSGFVPDTYLEFFTPIAKLAKNGMVRGLVPAGVSNEVRGDVLIKKTKLKRQIFLLTRKSSFHRSDLKEFIHKVKKQSKELLKSL